MDPANCLNVEHYDSYERTMKSLATTTVPVYLYFYGKKNEKGISWCSDCNKSYEFILQARDLYANPESIFIEVDVGSYDEFKDINNKFRQDPSLKIKCTPTLIRWNSVKRLEELHYCSNLEILQLFFEDGED